MDRETKRILEETGVQRKGKWEFYSIINPAHAVELVGEIAKQLKNKKIAPDYVVLMGTEAFVLDIPVGYIFEKFLGKWPVLLTPVLSRTCPLLTHKREISRQLKIVKANKSGTYLILDVSMLSGSALFLAKTALNAMTKSNAKIYTAVLACNKKNKEKVEKAGKNPLFDSELENERKHGAKITEDSLVYYLDVYLPDFVGMLTKRPTRSSWIKSEWIGLAFPARKQKVGGHLCEHKLKYDILPEKRRKRAEIMRKLTYDYLKKKGFKQE